MAQSFNAAELIADDKKYVWHHLTQHKVFEKSDPTVLSNGKGMRIKDIYGKEYWMPFPAASGRSTSVTATKPWSRP